VTKRILLLVDAALVVLAGWLGVTLYDAWRGPQRAGSGPTVASTASARVDGEPAASPAQPAPAPLAAFAPVADKNLFSPNRTEVAPEPPKPPPPPGAAPPAASAPKPRLYGIVLGAREGGRAYLEDPRTRKVFGYTTGDSVADSRVEKIETDRVVMRRGSEVFEVMLRDPSKPRPVPPPAPPPAAGAPGAAQPGAQSGAAPMPFQPAPGAPAPFQPVAPGGGVNPFQPATPGTNPFGAPASPPGAFQPAAGARRASPFVPPRPQPGAMPRADGETTEADE
jgi:hypothetical protein